MVLGQNQAALAGQFDLRFVRENPRSRRYHVSFEPQNGLEDLVPNLERNPRVIFCLTRRPARQQILVVDEETSVFENRGRKMLVQGCW